MVDDEMLAEQSRKLDNQIFTLSKSIGRIMAEHNALVEALDRLEKATFWSNAALTDEDAQGALKQARRALAQVRP